MNLKKIYRLMNKYGLKCPIRKANPYRRISKALKTSNIADCQLILIPKKNIDKEEKV